METAELLKDNLKKFTGRASLYKLSKPLLNYEFVICSTACPFGMGIETYIFGADESGEVVHWGELPGSMKGTSSHEEVLNEAGYQLLEIEK